MRQNGVEPTVPNHFVPTLVSFALRQGVAPEPLFASVGESLGSARLTGTQFSVRQVEQLFEALCEAVGDRGLALQLGRDVDAERLGLFGLLLSSAGTPRAAFAALSEFKGLFHPLLDLVVEERDACTYLRYASNDGSPIGDRPYYAEVLLSTLHCASGLFWGQPMLPLYVAFRHPAPAYLRAYEQTFRCSLRFEQPVDELCYHVRFLDRPWRGASDSHGSLRSEAQRVLASEEPVLIRQVKRVVRARIREPDLTLDDVARVLALSTRSLQRSLQLSGTSFRALRDDVRYQRARSLLQDSTRTTEATALELGYRDRSNFVRAFERWSGQSPSDFRRSRSGAK